MKSISTQLCAAAALTLLSGQSQAVTLTFDDPGAVGSAETFYASQGVLFSGGGLLADGPNGGMPGQPQFATYGGQSVIATLSKDTSGAYSDSFFDIWVEFMQDVYTVSGDYIGNEAYGATVSAYDAGGTLLDSISFSALSPISSSVVSTIGTFDFTTTSPIAHLHLLSDGNVAASILDNLSFQPVPIPAAVWLFGSGLAGLIAVARRKSA